MKSWEKRLDFPHASFSTASHELHRQRRTALNPFFSQQKVLQHSCHIVARAEKLCKILESEYGRSQRVLVVDRMISCFATDTILNYCFDDQSDTVSSENFGSRIASAVRDIQGSMHWTTAFPILRMVGNYLPEVIVARLFPWARSIISYRKVSILYFCVKSTSLNLSRAWSDESKTPTIGTNAVRKHAASVWCLTSCSKASSHHPKPPLHA